ncbi:MAG: hypothetical protein M0P64_01720 [Candidatus Pacebacteria bacterium]|jgi:hypothetical protein|nr:hypothetical protein [Candidatus Paceibacterota bacterium]
MNWNLSWGSVCMSSVKYFRLILLIGATIFIPSVVMFFTKKHVFESWKITLMNYIYVYIAILILVPWYSGDEFLHIEKDIIALIVSVGYVLFSLIYILYKSLQKDQR